jgi:hypothetical protein
MFHEPMRTHEMSDDLSGGCCDFGGHVDEGVKALSQANGITDPNKIAVGQTLTVPPPSAAGAPNADRRWAEPIKKEWPEPLNIRRQ